MKTEFSIDDRGNVVDFYYGDEFIAKLNREETVNEVEDQSEFTVIYPSLLPELEEYLIFKDGYRIEIQKAKKNIIYRDTCKRKIKKCDHHMCMCMNCESGLENEGKCNTCDYKGCCDKERK